MAGQNTDIEVIDNTNTTIRSTLRQTDGTTSNGTVTTTLSSSQSGSGADAVTTFTLQTSDSSYAPSDATAAHDELVEFCGDMIAHWQRVLSVVQNA